MEQIINSLLANKILLAIVILLASLLIYSILKRIVKLIVILLIALLLYAGYLNYKGEKIDPALQQYLDKSGIDLDEIQKQKEKLTETVDTINRVNSQAENRASKIKKTKED